MTSSIADIALYIPFAACFVLAALHDLKTLEIPNYISILLLGIGGVKVICTPYAFFSAVLGLVAVGLLLLVPCLFVDALGGGDIKLCAAAACVVGCMPAALALITGLGLAVLYSLIFRKGKAQFALAPFLAVGFLIFYFY